jgi:seryl-tRNA synthetase
MHDIRLIRDNPDAFDEGLRRRGLKPLSAELIALDERRRAAIQALQEAQERRNALSREVGAAKKAKDEERASALMAEVAALKDSAPALEAEEKAASEELQRRLAEIPNTPNSDVPEGSDETGNVVRHEWGTAPAISSPKQHFELAEAWKTVLGPAMDFESAAKLSGSRFVVLKGQLARLERALGQFMLDLHTNEHGYTEVSPPLMVRDEAMFGTAQLPKFAEDQFQGRRRPTEEELNLVYQRFLERERNEAQLGTTDEPLSVPSGEQVFGSPVMTASKRGYVLWEELEREVSGHWLIPTAEVPLTNLVRESILSEEELPLRFTALTPCFRAEAGAAGRDTRGMLRQHQFTKCELVSITTPDKSAEEHERMLACAEEVLKRLELPFRTMVLCTGDMGFASAKTYDIEVFVPGQATYREISSCSVCNDFQARRMNARYRPKDEKGTRFLHTLNGSGVAVGRALIAVLENYQQPDGAVAIPSALQPYLGGLTSIGGPT